MSKDFNPKKYLGVWYQVMGYPSWFETNLDFNTTAQYSPNKDGSIKVKNTTIRNNETVTAIGKAVYLGNSSFHVSFEGYPDNNPQEANYIVDKIWYDKKGRYIFSAVTNKDKSMLFILSRTKSPSIKHFDRLLNYVKENFDGSKVLQISQLH